MYTSIQEEISVSYRHRIFFTRCSFNLENHLLRDLIIEDAQPETLPKRVLFLVDENLSQARPDLVPSIEAYCSGFPEHILLPSSPVLTPGGEAVKNSYPAITRVQELIERNKICRHSYVIAVGGGALLDMVGLAAATAHRGVRHIRFPTTTLSQDDSGVGVKNGINAFGKKNFIGSFAPPFAVINDFDFIRTLPERDKRAGYSEAVKVSLIRDASFFEELESMVSDLALFKEPAMETLIHRCAALHVRHIATSGDPFEFGSARPLDFGHWAAHKLEQITEYAVRHGEAVAIGIALDVIYSRRMGFLSESDCNRILNLLNGLGFDLFHEALLNRNPSGEYTVLAGLEEFREHLGGILTITLVKGIGKGFETNTMDQEIALQSMLELRERFGSSIQKTESSARSQNNHRNSESAGHATEMDSSASIKI